VSSYSAAVLIGIFENESVVVRVCRPRVSKPGTIAGHELWTLQLSPLVRPEEGIEKRGRNVEISKILKNERA
jgi:hypothetical protein